MRAAAAMLVNVTVPVFNEEIRLPRGLPRLHRFLCEHCRFAFEIVIANNGSTDGTREVAERLSRELPNVRVLDIQEKGRGGAVKTAWLASRADVLTYMDVDLATGLGAFPALVEAVASGRADIAIGSRLLPGASTSRGWRREMISRGYIRLARLLCGLRCSDTQCGFKAISREAAQALLPRVKDNGWFFDTELLARAERAGYRIAELAVEWTEDRDSRVRVLRTAWEDLRGLMRLRRQLPPAGPLGSPKIQIQSPKSSRTR